MHRYEPFVSARARSCQVSEATRSGSGGSTPARDGIAASCSEIACRFVRAKVTPCMLRLIQLRVAEIGIAQVGAAEICLGGDQSGRGALEQLGFGEIRSGRVGLDQDRLCQIGARQVRPFSTASLITARASLAPGNRAPVSLAPISMHWFEVGTGQIAAGEIGARSTCRTRNRIRAVAGRRSWRRSACCGKTARHQTGRPQIRVQQHRSVHVEFRRYRCPLWCISRIETSFEPDAGEDRARQVAFHDRRPEQRL